eukprot:5844282-Pleurochrysis_carterae.AAC.1
MLKYSFDTRRFSRSSKRLMSGPLDRYQSGKKQPPTATRFCHVNAEKVDVAAAPMLISYHR